MGRAVIRVWTSLLSQVLFVALLAGGAQAAGTGTLFFPFENDSYFSGHDYDYTNGLYASWTSDRLAKDSSLAGFLSGLFPSTPSNPNYRFGLFAGQSMFTPRRLDFAIPDPRDHPYGGWLYAGVRAYREDREDAADPDSGFLLDRVEATLGVVGPASGAANVQRWWHASGPFGGVTPRGWNYQIGNEPGLVISGQRIRRYWADLGGIEVEALPEVTASVGNIYDYVGVGGMVRVGRHLHADWGPARIEPGLTGADFVNDDAIRGFAWYVFAGTEGRVVLHNIFLDGNTIQPSRSVQRDNDVIDFVAGVGALTQYFRIQSVFTLRSPEFATQRGADEFLSVQLSFPML